MSSGVSPRIQGELQHGNARRIELHDYRRLDARRHQRTNRVGGGNDLRNRQVEIDVGLEIDLLHRQTIEGLRLHVLDAIDVGTDGILAVGADALLHLRRGQTGVLPDDRHHRDAYLWEDVRRHRPQRRTPQKQDQCRHHVEGVREPQCKSNNSHFRSLRRCRFRKRGET